MSPARPARPGPLPPGGRRRFVRRLLAGSLLVAGGGARFAAAATPASASSRRQGDVDPARMEHLARLLQETPRERVFDAAAREIRGGAGVREMLGGILLAGTRDISPRPPGTKFHAVLLVPSAHALTGDAAGDDIWLPVFTNIDTLKWGQERDIRESGDWTLPPPPKEKALTDDPRRARLLLERALEEWNERGADRAAVAAVRTLPRDELFEILWLMGARDHFNIGHEMIQVSQAYRALDMLGGHFSEPVIRSVVHGLLGGEKGPSTADFERNRKIATTLPENWETGKPDPGASLELLGLLRRATPGAAVDRVVEMLRRGVAPRSIWDGLRLISSEMLFRMRESPVSNAQLLAVHPLTHLNAFHFASGKTARKETRALLLLQATAWTALSRDVLRRAKNLEMDGPGIDALEPAPSPGLEETLRLHGDDVVQGASQMLQRAADPRQAAALMARVRELVRSKAPEHHHHKYAVAAFEEFGRARQRWAPRVLAPLLSYLPHPGSPDSPVAREARASLARFG